MQHELIEGRKMLAIAHESFFPEDLLPEVLTIMDYVNSYKEPKLEMDTDETQYKKRMVNNALLEILKVFGYKVSYNNDKYDYTPPLSEQYTDKDILIRIARTLRAQNSKSTYVKNEYGEWQYPILAHNLFVASKVKREEYLRHKQEEEERQEEEIQEQNAAQEGETQEQEIQEQEMQKQEGQELYKEINAQVESNIDTNDKTKVQASETNTQTQGRLLALEKAEVKRILALRQELDTISPSPERADLLRTQLNNRKLRDEFFGIKREEECAVAQWKPCFKQEFFTLHDEKTAGEVKTISAGQAVGEVKRPKSCQQLHVAQVHAPQTKHKPANSTHAPAIPDTQPAQEVKQYLVQPDVIDHTKTTTDAFFRNGTLLSARLTRKHLGHEIQKDDKGLFKKIQIQEKEMKKRLSKKPSLLRTICFG